MRCFVSILILLLPSAALAFDPESGEADLGDLSATRDARAFADAVELERLEKAFLLDDGESDSATATQRGGSATGNSPGGGVARGDNVGGDIELPAVTGRHVAPSPSVEDAVADAFTDSDWAFPFGLDVRHREPVATFVRFWTGRGRSTYARVLARMGRYEPLIRAILREEGVPEDIIYLCFIESGFATRALSPANARGLWQFIPATGINYGLRIDGDVDERLDPVKGTRAAARYLKSLHGKTGSWPLAMAGYNAGSGHVLSAMSKGNSNSYFTLARRDVLYDNTQNYVAKILAAGLVGRNLEKFGLDGIEKEAPLTWDEVDVPGGTLLSDAATAAGTDTETLKALNPELLHAVTPRRADTYPLRIPRGVTTAFVAAFDSLDQHGAHYTYTTRIGETLEMAADRLGVPTRTLRAVSGIDADPVPYGTRLLVPASAIEPDGVAHGEDLGPWLARRSASSRDRVQVTALLPETRFAYTDREQWFYRTREGDSVAALGAAFDIEPGDIAMWNALEPDAPIRKGLVLQLFLPNGAQERAVLYPPESTDAVYEGSAEWAQAYAEQNRRRPAGTATGGGRTYNVRAGDTLASIARRSGVTPEEVERWNNLRGRRLKPGYRLVLYGGQKAKPAERTERAERAPAPRAATPAADTAPSRTTRRPSRTSNVRFRRH